MCFTGDESWFWEDAGVFELTLTVYSLSETDDYAEIIDEEDTYTMPSSEYLCLISHRSKI